MLVLQENVVPASAWALVNHRVHPGQSLDEVVQYDRQVINDPSIKVCDIKLSLSQRIYIFFFLKSRYTTLLDPTVKINYINNLLVKVYDIND